MNRKEFMEQLERLLQDIPESDRQDAIAYYNDYFDEVGPENEASLIQQLGSPGKVAGIIKAIWSLEKMIRRVIPNTDMRTAGLRKGKIHLIGGDGGIRSQSREAGFRLRL
ncbi:MAG: DUF1700 domain-containing protein [Lachnospiraceae bacterium]